jgi:cytochrome c
MNPDLPSPLPDPLPAPAWLWQVLLVFTFVLHIVPMNLVMGGSFLAAWSISRRNEPHTELARQLVRMLPPAQALTITLGVAPLLFLQVLYGQLFFGCAATDCGLPRVLPQ